MSQDDDEPIELTEPEAEQEESRFSKDIWMRGLWMIVLALLFALAETVLSVVAVIQFLWMLFTKEKNELLSEFGKDLGLWLSDVARFQSGATEEKPFPWKSWGE